MISSYTSLVPFMTQEGVRPPTLNPWFDCSIAQHGQLQHVPGAVHGRGRGCDPAASLGVTYL